MSDQLLTFFFIGLLAELAILLFMVFRRARGSCLAQLVIAFFAFFTLLMALLALVGSIEEPAAFTDQSRIVFPGAFVVLGLAIVAVGRGVPLSPAAPRKRPLFLDVLGCLVLGIVGLLVFVAGIAFLAMLGR